MKTTSAALLLTLPLLFLGGCAACEDELHTLPPAIDVAPLQIDLGEVELGSEARAVLHVSSVGTGALQLSAGRFEDEVPGLGLFPALGFPFTIEPGAELGFSIAFAPIEVSAIETALLLSSNDPDAPVVRIPVVGAGIAKRVPHAVVAPEVIDFGDVLVGAARTLTVTLQNAGDAPLTLVESRLEPLADAVVVDDAQARAAPLAPNSSQPITVTYAPLAQGGLEGMLVLVTDDPEQPERAIPVRGRGIAPGLVVAPLALSFDGTPVGSTAERAFTVENRGTSPLTISGVSLAGLDPARFSLVFAGTPMLLQPGAPPQPISVAFSPVDGAAFDGHVLVQSDDPNAPAVEVQVTAQGALPSVCGVSQYTGAPGVVFSDGFDDGVDPSRWTQVLGAWHQCGSGELCAFNWLAALAPEEGEREGVLEIERSNAPSNGEVLSARHALNLDLAAADEAVVRFDARPRFSDVANCTGFSDSEAAVSVELTLTLESGATFVLQRALNDCGRDATNVAPGFRQDIRSVTGWADGEEIRIQDLLAGAGISERARCLSSITLRSAGWNFRAWYDDVEVELLP